MASAILITLTVVTLALRYIRIAQPLFQFIPLKYRWVPSAVFAAATVIQPQVGAIATVADLVGVVLEGVVAFALAAQAGVHNA